MKKYIAMGAAILAALGAGVARADDNGNRTPTSQQADAGALTARGQLGLLDPGDTAATGRSPSREQVMQGVIDARRSGELAAGQASLPSESAVQAPSRVSRQQVINDFKAARSAPPDALTLERSV